MKKDNLRILLIEDSPLQQLLLKTVLGGTQIESYTLKVSNTFNKGFKRLKANRYDLLFLDLHLPDISGFNGLRQIQSTFDNLPVIIMTGTYDRTIEEKAMKEGARVYITKGEYTSQTIEQAIQSCL